MTIGEQAGVATVPGLRFRHYTGPDDLPAIVAIEKAENLADSFAMIPTLEQMTIRFAAPDGFDPAQDVLIAELDGDPVGFGIVTFRARDEERSFELHGCVRPDVRRRGIGRAILHRNVERARERAATLPSGPPIRFSTWAVDSAVGHHVLLESEGFQPVRYFFEMIKGDLASPPPRALPDGLERRPVTMATVRQVFDAENEAFRDHWGHHEFTDEEFNEIVKDPDLVLDLWRVAWDGDEVAGVVAVGVYTEENSVLGLSRGWLDRISVRRPWRHRGLASALILSACAGLREHGITEAALGVDAENPHGALGLYESLGFAQVQRATTRRRPLDAGEG
jgi:mycothiol synthase